MSENENSSLIRRPNDSVEKAEPGAKRVLSGMVVDTLALVTKKPLVKPVFSVLVAGGMVDSHAESFEAILRAFLSDQFDLRLVGADNAGEVLRLAEQQSFDLFIVLLNQVWQGLNEIQLDPPEEGMWGDRISFLARLKKQFGKPIIAMSGIETMEFAERVHRAGADAFFTRWSSEIPSFLAVVRSCLKFPRDTVEKSAKTVPQPGKTRPLRIIVVLMRMLGWS